MSPGPARPTTTGDLRRLLSRTTGHDADQAVRLLDTLRSDTVLLTATIPARSVAGALRRSRVRHGIALEALDARGADPVDLLQVDAGDDVLSVIVGAADGTVLVVNVVRRPVPGTAG